jgi:hypothetical protein
MFSSNTNKGADLNNGGMIAPPRHHFLEVFDEIRDCLIVSAAVLLHHVLEDKHAETVGVIIPALVFRACVRAISPPTPTFTITVSVSVDRE